MTGDELRAALKRHLGHTLRCSRDECKAGDYVIETVVLRCELCGEVVIETVEQRPLNKRRAHART